MASHNAPVRELPELTSLGNNDLELFWRLLRVVRRLDAQDNGLLESLGPSSAQPPRRTETEAHLPRRRSQAAKRQRRSKARQVQVSEDEYDDDDESDELEDEDDEEEEDDEDDREEEASSEDKTARGLTIHVATSDESANTKDIAPPSVAKRKRQVGQRKYTGASASSQHQRQLQQQRERELEQQKQQQELEQQQQRQREQEQQQQQRDHAVVEKRYRSVINSKIQQLNDIIPPSNRFDPADTSVEPGHPEGQDVKIKGAQKTPTKSVVLDRALQYLTHLVSTYQQYEKERDDLRRRIQSFVDDVLPLGEPGIIPAVI